MRNEHIIAVINKYKARLENKNDEQNVDKVSNYFLVLFNML